MEPVFLAETPRPMAVVPLNVEQYHSMRETGILAEDAPVELIDGLLVYKDRGGALPVSPLHTFVIHRMTRLAPALEERGCHLRLENPITLPPSHEPEPDGAVVQGRPEDYLERHPGPGDVLCVIEVSDSSLRYDRTTKQSIYAAAGIAQFIIVNLVEGRIEIYEDPNVAEKCYGLVRILYRGDTISLRVPGDRTLGVPAADWLPEVRPGPSATAPG
jgi:Uma2 family endonuclease